MNRPTRHDVRLRVLPLALAAVFVTTAVPVELGGPVGWDRDPQAFDFVVNLLLYAPLGAALSRRRWPWAAGVALLLSLLIESTQMGSCGRTASLWDVAANTGGALAAALLARRWPTIARLAATGVTVGRRGVALAALALVALVGVGNLPARSAALAGWDADYPLQLGNEATGDRPWRGTIADLALSAGSGAVTTWNVAPGTVTLAGGPAQALSTGAARDFARAAQGANAFAVTARVTPASLEQWGPARLVSFSSDPYHRNFDLGQEGEQLVFRLRTPVSGDNGEDHRVESAALLREGRPVTVTATYDGAVARLRVDGRLVGRSSLAAAAGALPGLVDRNLLALGGLAGALLALLAAAFVPTRGRALFTALAAAQAAVLLDHAVPGVATALAALRWLPLAAGAGIAGVALALRPAPAPTTPNRSYPAACS